MPPGVQVTFPCLSDDTFGPESGCGLAGQLALDEWDAQPARCKAAGLALRASADDVVAATHDGNSLPACSATMYSAYQSGQFSSRWPPVRVSCSPWAADARRRALARSDAESKLVAFESMRPGNRAVTSCNSHSLPSG